MLSRFGFSLVRFIQECLTVSIAPYWLVRGIANYLNGAGGSKGLYISQSAGKNAINDSTWINLTANWMKRYGYWGVNYENMGKPLGLAYPPLTYLLCRFIGPEGIFVLTNLIFVAAVAILAVVARQYILLALIPYVMVSPFYKNQVIVTGRYDTMGLTLYLLMLLCCNHGFLAWALAAFLLAGLMHPSMLILGGLTLGLEVIVGNIPIMRAFFMGVLVLVMLMPWLYPYVSNARITGNIAHSWRPAGFTDKTRRLGVHLQKTIFYGVFAGAYIFRNGNMETTLLLLIPLILEINDFFSGSFFNRFSIDFLKIVMGLYCLAQNSTVGLLLLYLLALYFYASPASRGKFDIRTLRLEPVVVEAFQQFFSPMEGKKGIFLSPVASADEWRLAGKYWGLSLLINSYRFTPGYMQWFPMERVRCGEVDTLRNGAGEIGAEFLVTTLNDRLPETDFKFLDRMTLPEIGDIPPGIVSIYRIRNASGPVEPKAVYEIAKNRITIAATQGQEYSVAFMPTRGWRAVCNGTKIPLATDSGTIRFQALRSTTHVLKHSYLSYWRCG